MITVTKLDAAKRQLDTSIRLWLEDGDPVSIHTLCFSAHQIIHDVNHQRGGTLLMDAPFIRPEMRGQFIAILKEHGNYFKHADNRGKKLKDPPFVEFEPALNDAFIGLSIEGLTQLGEKLTSHAVAFRSWSMIHKPHLFNDAWQDHIKDGGPAQLIASVKEMPRKEFFETVLAFYGER